ncbi:LysM peptidoglycan-binding domain-containing protein [Frondihabitans australicus]|uniref:LysM repeat protein n=1 Tax=Frondihabitans australicus TaxID=386892 RepID=A0A495IEX5_9MICO|nr:LysM peptidoglycan-binding domain-containing protein [Frondihabitans australicus]RKR74319.1 LysM repeat protein [Frondihabitans australicus]
MNASDETRGTGGPISRTAAYRLGRSMLGTVPIVLAGTMAVTMGATGQLAADHVQPHTKRPEASPAPATTIDLSAIYRSRQTATLTADNTTADVTTDAVLETASTAPTTYTVVAGDTVASIAGRYGLSTASVLALNGLSWKSTIYPGQTLHLTSARATAAAAASVTKPHASTTGTYTIVRGDTLSSIAARHGVSTQALLDANGLGWSSIIYPGQKLRMPGASTSAPAPSSSAPSKAAAPATTTAGSSKAGSTKYTIRTGDTLSSIAKAHATTVDRLLAANGLSWSSTIYAGKQLTIPGAATTATASVGGTSTVPVSPNTLSAAQRSNALTIIRVGRALGVSDYGIVVALSAAAQESGLENLSSGDRDSVGLFQQRPSQGWGSKAQLLNTTYAAELFYGGSRNPNAGVTRGLLDIRGWSSMTVTQAAQAVQNSAYPTAYAKWEKPARLWLATL